MSSTNNTMIDNILNKSKLSRTDLSTIYKKIKELRLKISWLDLFRKSSREATINKLQNAIKPKSYNVSYIIYTKFNEDKQYKKGTKTITINGVKYIQMGKPNDFKTNNDFFSNNFNFNNSGIGSKNNIVDRRDDRFNETVKYIQQAVKDINALHLLSYIDAVYIYKLKEVKKVKSINVKTEKKFDNNILNSVYNNYLYYDIKNNNEYENNLFTNND